MFGSAPILYVDVEMFGGNWREKDVKTSKMFMEISVEYARIETDCSFSPIWFRPQY